MPFEALVALRFLREGRVQTLLIVAGITVGVAVVVFVSALIQALERDLTERTLATQAHVVARAHEDENLRAPAPGVTIADVQKRLQRERTIGDWARRLEAAREVPGVRAAAAVAAGPGMAGRGGVTRAIQLIGVELGDYLQVLALADKVVAGEFALPAGTVVIGTELAADLGLRVGDRLRLDGGRDAQAATVMGLVDFGAKEPNQRWVLLPLRSAQALLGYPMEVTELYLKTDGLYEASAIAAAVARRTGLQADSWMERNTQLLNALRSQASSSLVIRAAVMLSVALAIASVLVITVVQRSAEIGVMRAYGVRAGSIVWIFLLQGAALGLLGSLAGIGLANGLIEAAAQGARSAGRQFPPAVVDQAMVVSTAALAIAVGTLAALVPALRAARMDPVQAMRHV